jgi:AraC-like DNA-binding protein
MATASRTGSTGPRPIPFPEYPNIVGLHDCIGEGPARSVWHRHPWAEINIMLEGRAVWSTEEGVFDVSAGDAFLILPGMRHHADYRAGEQHRTGTVGFLFEETSGTLLGAHGWRHDEGPPRARVLTWLFDALSIEPLHRLNWDGFSAWWRALYTEQDAPRGPYRALRVESAMLEVLSRFADPAFWQTKTEQIERRGVGSALRLISEKAAEGPVSVIELARVAGMSRSKFADLFHRTVGMPPHAYVTAMRLWMAQSALVGTQASVASIASLLGFSSPQYFSRAFRTATGLTPQEYRHRWGEPWFDDTDQSAHHRLARKRGRAKAPRASR